MTEPLFRLGLADPILKRKLITLLVEARRRLIDETDFLLRRDLERHIAEPRTTPSMKDGCHTDLMVPFGAGVVQWFFVVRNRSRT